MKSLEQGLLSLADVIHYMQDGITKQVIFTKHGAYIRPHQQLEPSWDDQIATHSKPHSAWYINGNWMQSHRDSSWKGHARIVDVIDPHHSRLLHERYFHRNLYPLWRCQKAGMVKADLTRSDLKAQEESACIGCCLTKAIRRPKPPGSKPHPTGEKVFGIIAFDLQTPVTPTGLGGIKHYLHIVDAGVHGSGGAFVYPLQTKESKAITQALKHFATNWIRPSRPAGTTPAYLFETVRSDNAKEFLYGDTHEYLTANGCQFRQKTVPAGEASYQNGAAERCIRTITDMANAALRQRNVPLKYHPLAMQAAAQAHLLLPNQRNPDCAPPITIIDRVSKTVDLTSLRTFWCLVVTVRLADGHKSQRFRQRGRLGHYIGFEWGTKAVKVLYRPSNEIELIPPDRAYFIEHQEEEQRILNILQESKGTKSDLQITVNNESNEPLNVILDAYLPHINKRSQALPEESNATPTSLLPSPINDSPAPQAVQTIPEEPDEDITAQPNVDTDNNSNTDVDQQQPRYPSRNRQPVDHGPYIGRVTQRHDQIPAYSIPTPKRYGDWGQYPQEWIQAANKEFKQFWTREVWRWEKPTRDATYIRPLWVWKVKPTAQGYVDSFKARLTAQGQHQIPGRDFSDNWAPTANARSLRLIMYLAVYMGSELKQADVTAAYLYSLLEPHLRLYLNTPPGMEHRPGMALRIIRGIYGLKQAGHLWYKTYSDVLINHCKLKRSKLDPCIFYKPEPPRAVIGIHVDDNLMTGLGPGNEHIMDTLLKHFKMKVNAANWFLNLSIQSSPDGSTIGLSGKTYIDSLQTKFEFLQAAHNRTCVPYTTVKGMWKQEPTCAGGDTPVNDKLYASMIGCCAWPATHWRPDVAFATFRAARYSKEPKHAHFKGVKTILHYLRSTPSEGLLYTAPEHSPDHIQLVAFTDADFAGDTDTSASTMGVLIYADNKPYSDATTYPHRNLIDWVSKRIKKTAATPGVAETHALYEGYQRITWLADLLTELGYTVPTPIIYCDCEPVITAVKNGRPSGALTTSRLSRAAIAELHQAYTDENAFKLLHVQGNLNPADYLTKANHVHTKFQQNRTTYFTTDMEAQFDIGV